MPVATTVKEAAPPTSAVCEANGCVVICGACWTTRTAGELVMLPTALVIATE